MLYTVYIDEFGHIGRFVSLEHARYRTHPVFGLGGFAIPHNKVREFSTYYYKLKNSLLKFEINASGKTPNEFEKKGSSLYTIQNITKYNEIRQATFRLLNRLNKLGGFVIYVGLEKDDREDHSSQGLYRALFNELLKRLEEECEQSDSYYLILMDQVNDHHNSDLRRHIVKSTAINMYAGTHDTDPKRRLIEPPIEVESHLYQNIQFADWICGIIGRLSFYETRQDEVPEYEIAKKYFGSRIAQAQRRSGIRKTPKIVLTGKLEALEQKFNNK